MPNENENDNEGEPDPSQSNEGKDGMAAKDPNPGPPDGVKASGHGPRAAADSVDDPDGGDKLA